MNNRKCILYIALSLDGYIADSSGSVEWLEGVDGNGSNSGYADFIEHIDTVLMGRVTYDQVLKFGDWPYKGLQSYVFSHSDHIDNPQVTVVNQSPAALLGRIRQHPGKDIWLMGGARLVNSFLQQNLVDEMILTMIPRLLGNGIRLFAGTYSFCTWQLKSSRQMGEIVELSYEREGLHD